VVEAAHDARIREAVQLSFGRVLHPDEVAADKTLALFGRAAARDLVDVAALSARYPLEWLCELTAEKDAGFDRRVSPTRCPPPRPALTPPLPNSAQSRRLSPPSGQVRLNGEPSCWMPRTCPPRTRCNPSADGQGQRLPDYHNSLRPSERHRSSPSTPVETGHRGPAKSAGIISSRCAGWVFAHRLGLPGWGALLFPVVASRHDLVHDLLACWRGES
jgi:hypothetical protein